MKYWKLYDYYEYRTMGLYSTYNKAKSAFARLVKDTDGDCDLEIVARESKPENEDRLAVVIDKDNW